MDREEIRTVGRELQVAHMGSTKGFYFHGKSMEPFLREGDHVLIHPTNWKDLQVGDLVIIREGDKFPVRRILKKAPHRLSLRADGWIYYRRHARKGEVLGRAEARCRNGEWLRNTNPAWKQAARKALIPAFGRAILCKLFGILFLQKKA